MVYDSGFSLDLINEVCERSAAMRISTVVDKIFISGGPSLNHCIRAKVKLDRTPTEKIGKGIPTRIQFKTNASDDVIEGLIYWQCLDWNSDTDLYYAGAFHGQLVEGNYNPVTGEGDMQDL